MNSFKKPAQNALGRSADGESFLDTLWIIWNAVEARFSSECRTNPAQAAAEDLQLILTGECAERNEMRLGDIIIKREVLEEIEHF